MEKLKVTLQDRPIDDELAQYKRMFESACSALAAISDALLVDPEEGGVEPILAAIADLKDSALQPVKQEPVADESPRFETEDHDLTTLLELTVDIYSGICNHDTAVWWHETLGKVEAKLTPVERQWVDLTDEEIYKCRSDYGEYETCRSVIAKFKEKNK